MTEEFFTLCNRYKVGIRLITAFESLGVANAEDICLQQETDFLKLRNFGQTTLQELKALCTKLNVSPPLPYKLDFKGWTDDQLIFLVKQLARELEPAPRFEDWSPAQLITLVRVVRKLNLR